MLEVLKEGQEKYKALFENANDAILIAAVESGMILDANKSAEKLFGWSKNELIGMNRMQLHPKDKTAHYREQFQRHVISGSFYEEAIVVKKDGTPVSVEINPSVIEINGKKVIQGIFRDLTERKQIEQERAGIQAQLMRNEKMAAVGQIAAGVAHEINNPMTAILGFTQILLQMHKEGDEDFQKLKSIEMSSKRCRDIVQQLLLYSRTKQTGAAPVDIHEMLNRVLSLVEKQFQTSGISLVKDYKEKLPLAFVSHELEQAFANLISNAKDAMPAGGRLIVKTDIENGKITVKFSDTGDGISRETLEKIFTPFYTTKKAGQGTGLGLSIVKTLLSDIDGEITVESELNKGAAFTVFLPLKSDK